MSKLNELLADVEDAYTVAETKRAALTAARAKEATAVAAKQAELDKVKGEQAKLVSQAEIAAEDARVALDRLREQVNERLGVLTASPDPRVSVSR